VEVLFDEMGLICFGGKLNGKKGGPEFMDLFDQDQKKPLIYRVMRLSDELFLDIDGPGKNPDGDQSS
jgi:hypothetical protein